MAPPDDISPSPEDATQVDDRPEDTAENDEKQKLSLDVSVASPSACERHVTVTISREDVDRHFKEAIDELLPDADVPGFRPGHAPRKLVEGRFRKEINEKIKGTLLVESLEQVNQEQEFSAISEPDFEYDAVIVPAEGPMVFEFKLEVRPDIDMPEWKGLKIERPVREFTREDVDRRLKSVLKARAELVPYSGEAQRDDFITLDATFKHDGKTVSRLREETVCVKSVLSFHDARLEGFDDLMQGAKADDTKETTLTLSSEAANEELRGQEVTAEFKVLEVKRLELPEFDDQMLEQFGVQSEGELRDAVQFQLERELAYHQRRQAREQITSLLTATADWTLPPDMLRRQSGRELERAVMELRSAGFTEEQIQAHENQLRQNSISSTETALKEHFILERIAEEEEFDVTPADYDREIERIASQSQESPRRVRAQIEKRGMMDVLRNQIIERKVIHLITSHAQFTEVEFTPKTEGTEAVDHAVGGGDPAAIPEAKHGGEAEELREPVDHT